MRGALIGYRRHGILQRIIPADAGSTKMAIDYTQTPKDHPRGCGEHRLIDHVKIYETGSSPRMRGALQPGDTLSQIARIIPADAGSTCSGVHFLARVWDHPRGCGEHRPDSCRTGRNEGSSPRMRGAHIRSKNFNIPGGIIPADAGSTHASNSKSPALTDHPRGCGEHDMSDSGRTCSPGSSPRMRGAPVIQRIS